MSTLRLMEATPARARPIIENGVELAAAAAALGRRMGATAWRLAKPIVRIVLKAMVEHKIRRASRELARLDDRTLRDIGLSRCGLEDAVRSNRAHELIPFGLDWDLLDGKDHGRRAGRKTS